MISASWSVKPMLKATLQATTIIRNVIPTVMALLAGCALGCVAVGSFLVYRARRRRDPRPASYVAALRLLARRGLVRSPATTARTFSRSAALCLSPLAADAFEALTEHYLAERFGDAGYPAGEAKLLALRAALRSG